MTFLIRFLKAASEPNPRSFPTVARPFGGRAVSLFVLLATWLAFLLLAPPAFAFGVGGYLDYLHGDGEIEFDLFGKADSDFESDKFGFGFVFDTNLARNRLFNYRGTFGYQRTSRDFDRLDVGPFSVDLGEIDADGFTFNSAFGFGVSRGPTHRLWLGPAFRIGVDVFDTETSQVDIVDASVGIGPAIGLNLHAGHNFTIGLTAAYQYLYLSEVVRFEDVFGNSDETEQFDGHEHLVSLNLTFFFRSNGDQFDVRSRRDASERNRSRRGRRQPGRRN